MGNLYLYSIGGKEDPGHNYFLQDCNRKIHAVPDRSCFIYQKAKHLCFCSLSSNSLLIVSILTSVFQLCRHHFCVCPLVHSISSKPKDLSNCPPSACSLVSSILQYCKYTDMLLVTHTHELQLFSFSSSAAPCYSVQISHFFICTKNLLPFPQKT